MPRPEPVILVVEDHADVAKILVRLFQGEGYAVAMAADARAALEHIEAGGIDLLLLDLILPGMGGLELCRQVRARGAAVGDYLPVIMVTGASDEAQRSAGFEAGADDYITKPFALADVLDRVRVWLRTRQRLLSAQEAADLAKHAWAASL